MQFENVLVTGAGGLLGNYVVSELQVGDSKLQLPGEVTFDTPFHRTIQPTTNTIGHALTAPPVELVKIATVLPQFWMETMGTWQKNWSDAMGVWMKPSEKEKRPSRRKAST